jgi:hypothetical protein
MDKLEEMKYPKLSHDADALDIDKSYKYITDLPLFSLTQDIIDELKKDYVEKKNDYDDYMKTPVSEIWKREINEFIDKYQKWIVETEKEKLSDTKQKKTKTKAKK